MPGWRDGTNHSVARMWRLSLGGLSGSLEIKYKPVCPNSTSTSNECIHIWKLFADRSNNLHNRVNHPTFYVRKHILNDDNAKEEIWEVSYMGLVLFIWCYLSDIFCQNFSPHALMDTDNNQHLYCVSCGQGVVHGVLTVAPKINPIKKLEGLYTNSHLIAPGRGNKDINV